jgi:arylsulfatase A-like enzyme
MRFLETLAAFGFPLIPLSIALSSPDTASMAKPNVVWIVVDDMSSDFGSYGGAVATPHVDELAAAGVRFANAFVTAPVCSSSRSAMITGCYQTVIGAHHHRSGRGEHRIQLPEGVRLLPELMREAGYHTCIGSGVPGLDHRGLPTRADRRGKTDYNFDWDPDLYDSHDWADRKPGQPFFMQVQLHGGKLRGDRPALALELAKRAAEMFGESTDPYSVELPRYYPRDPVLLEDWAAYLDSVRITDWHAGEVVRRLKEEGEWERTILIFMTDHGISHARGKQFLYDEGTRIPFIVTGPGVPAGTVREDLIEHIDMAGITLGAAGLPVHGWMQARNPLAPDYQPRETVFAARDRCGEAADMIRSARTGTHLYIRNFFPRRPLLLPNNYKDSKAIVARLKELRAEGQLDELQTALLFAEERPAEELYAWREDRWQIQNLADDPAHAEVLADLRGRLEAWMEQTGDPGSESEEVYQAEIADELATIKAGSARHIEFEANSRVYLEWMRSGR